MVTGIKASLKTISILAGLGLVLANCSKTSDDPSVQDKQQKDGPEQVEKIFEPRSEDFQGTLGDVSGDPLADAGNATNNSDLGPEISSTKIDDVEDTETPSTEEEPSTPIITTETSPVVTTEAPAPRRTPAPVITNENTNNNDTNQDNTQTENTENENAEQETVTSEETPEDEQGEPRVQNEPFNVPTDPDPDANPLPIITSTGTLSDDYAKINTFGDTMVFHYTEEPTQDGFWNPQFVKLRDCDHAEDKAACARNNEMEIYYFDFAMKKSKANPGLTLIDPNPNLSTASADLAAGLGTATTSLIPDATGSNLYPDFLVLTSCYGHPSLVSQTKGDKDIVVLANDSDVYKRTIDYNSFDDLSDFLSLPQIFVKAHDATTAKEDKTAAFELVEYFGKPGMTIPDGLDDAAMASQYSQIMKTFVCKSSDTGGRLCSDLGGNAP